MPKTPNSIKISEISKISKDNEDQISELPISARNNQPISPRKQNARYPSPTSDNKSIGSISSVRSKIATAREKDNKVNAPKTDVENTFHEYQLSQLQNSELSLSKNPARNKKIHEIAKNHKLGEYKSFSNNEEWGLDAKEIKEAFNVRIINTESRYDAKHKVLYDNNSESIQQIKELSEYLVSPPTTSESAEIHLKHCLNQLGQDKFNQFFKKIVSKYQNLNLSDEYKLYILKQEIKLIEEQIALYREKISIIPVSFGFSGQNTITNKILDIDSCNTDLRKSFQGVITERIKKFDRIEQNQVEKASSGSLTFADKNPDFNGFDSKILPQKTFNEKVLKGKILSGEQTEILLQLQNIILTESRAKVLGLLDTAMGKTFITGVIKDFIDEIQKFIPQSLNQIDTEIKNKKNFPSEITNLQQARKRFEKMRGISFEEINLANQDVLLTKKREAGAIVLQSIDESHFISEQNPRESVNAGVKIIKFGASENYLKIVESLQREVEKDTASIKINENQRRISKLENDLSKLTEINGLSASEDEACTYRKSLKNNFVVNSVAAFNPDAYLRFINWLGDNDENFKNKFNKEAAKAAIEKIKDSIQDDKKDRQDLKRKGVNKKDLQKKQDCVDYVKVGEETKVVFKKDHKATDPEEYKNLRKHIKDLIQMVNKNRSGISAALDEGDQGKLETLHKEIKNLRQENAVLKKENEISRLKIYRRKEYVETIEDRRNVALDKVAKAKIENYVEPTVDNFANLVIEHGLKNFRTQNLFSNIAPIDNDEFRGQLEKIAKDADAVNKTVLANLVENDEHVCVIAKMEDGKVTFIKTPFSDDPNSKFRKEVTGIGEAVMLYFGKKNEGYIGIDFADASVLVPGRDRQNLFTTASTIESDILKQGLGRNRGESEVTEDGKTVGLNVTIFTSNKNIKTPDECINIAKEATKKKDLADMISHYYVSEKMEEGADLRTGEPKLRKYLTSEGLKKLVKFVEEKKNDGEAILRIVTGESNNELKQQFNNDMLHHRGKLNEEKFIRDLRLFFLYHAIEQYRAGNQDIFDVTKYLEKFANIEDGKVTENEESDFEIRYVFDAGTKNDALNSLYSAVQKGDFDPMDHIKIISHFAHMVESSFKRERELLEKEERLKQQGEEIKHLTQQAVESKETEAQAYSAWVNRLGNLAAEIAKLNSEKEKTTLINDERKDLDAEIKRLDNLRLEIIQNIEEAEQRAEQYRSKHGAAYEGLENTKKDLQELNRKNAESLKDSEAKKVLLKTKIQKIQTAEKFKNGVLEQIAEFAEALQDRKKDQESLNTKKANAIAELEKAAGLHKKLKQESEEKDSAYKALKKELKQLASTKKQAEEDLASESQAQFSILAEIAKIQEEKSRIQKQVNDILSHIAELTAQIDEKNKELDKANKELSAEDKSHSDLVVRNDKLTKDLALLKNDLDKANSLKDAHEKTEKTLGDKLENLKLESDAAALEIEEKQEKIKKLEDAFSEKKLELEKIKENAEQVEDIVNSITQRISFINNLEARKEVLQNIIFTLDEKQKALSDPNVLTDEIFTGLKHRLNEELGKVALAETTSVSVPVVPKISDEEISMISSLTDKSTRDADKSVNELRSKKESEALEAIQQKTQAAESRLAQLQAQIAEATAQLSQVNAQPPVKETFSKKEYVPPLPLNEANPSDKAKNNTGRSSVSKATVVEIPSLKILKMSSDEMALRKENATFTEKLYRTYDKIIIGGLKVPEREEGIGSRKKKDALPVFKTLSSENEGLEFDENEKKYKITPEILTLRTEPGKESDNDKRYQDVTFYHIVFDETTKKNGLGIFNDVNIKAKFINCIFKSVDFSKTKIQAEFISCDLSDAKIPISSQDKMKFTECKLPKGFEGLSSPRPTPKASSREENSLISAKAFQKSENEPVKT